MLFTCLYTNSNYTFLTGASHPQELVAGAFAAGHKAIAITDECSLAGVVKAHVCAKQLGVHLIVGSCFKLSNGCKLVALAPNRAGYAELSGFITLARRRMPKGEYQAHLEDLRFRLQNCLIILCLEPDLNDLDTHLKSFSAAFKQRLWLGVSHQLSGGEQMLFPHWQSLSNSSGIPLVACDQILMHTKDRKPLQDVLTAIRHNRTLEQLGKNLNSNAEAYLKSSEEYLALYPAELIAQTKIIAEQCQFNLDELRYQYPRELVPNNCSPIDHLRQLVGQGKLQRWREGVPAEVETLLEKELSIIEELNYEYYFLTVHDIVAYARSQNILCQGRGSAANSVVCYCLFITEISPGQINVLFERFISKERDEPPDIDVDFEHQRREEVIQYIYQKYGRERAALAASVVTYRSRSAIRDVGKALGLDSALVDQLAKSLAWWDRSGDLEQRITSAGLKPQQQKLQLLFSLAEEIMGFPRHLSQHVGGFVITECKISDLVPLENASMPERTIIQWDKDDLEAMGLLKIDILALGMLTALRKCLQLVNAYAPNIRSLADIPRECSTTYNMLCAADTIGIFQIESRAQMSMLPRLKPRCFYDLVIEIAIVRPGPIQGDMVHPYLRRREGIEPISYPSQAIEAVLKPTLGVPIFQEQAIRLAMVAANFSGGEADQLRRAMASWGKNGALLQFEQKFISGMLTNNYSPEFAHRLFEQIKGFGGYGFPESHSASFALLCYASSWLKCHHPAAFYCALLNSQPMGFYSVSQLIQDARRHKIKVLPIAINHSNAEHSLEKHSAGFAVRLGFIGIKSLSHKTAEAIVLARASTPFESIEELCLRTQLSRADIQYLAAADVLQAISGNRHIAHWQAAALQPQGELLRDLEKEPQDDLFTQAPNIETDLRHDYQTTGLSLRVHPMALLRREKPFNRCKQQQQLAQMTNGGFVRVAGLVTGRQRPGTAKGTLFLTLEDETGNINVVVWKATQELFRSALLTSKLLLVKGRVEISRNPPLSTAATNITTDDNSSPVIHVIAGQLIDYSARLDAFTLPSRDFH
ncbi:error-prone DNA polymerase [Teredinibacter waterburyi]|uniref:error-prone DNA polymerase n=1 Tax=Teredinibacter waterburyi TaxID=1500538 RepID=UPI00165EE311|nr:error-prone DNA polymerase [Teredinibacter waterburyi]